MKSEKNLFKGLNTFIETLEGKKVHATTRVSPDVDKLLIKKAKELGMEPSEYIRCVLTLHVLPELLRQSLLKESKKMIIRQPKDAIELHYGEIGSQYKNIKELSEFAEQSVRDFVGEIAQSEVNCLNKINTKMSNELM